ncbi:MAG: hypothetical protein AAF337_02345 [Pseudomonadota bacterium]
MKLEKPQAPTDFNHPKRQILGPDQLDDLGLALITLTRELVVVNDRVKLLETALAQHGIDVAATIERQEPDETLQTDLDAAGSKIVNAVIGALAGQRP